MIAVDAANGATRWTWEVPAAGISSRIVEHGRCWSPGGVAVAAFIALIPPANAPKRIAAPPGPLRPTRISNVYGLEAGGDLVVLDGLTGSRCRWDLTDVAGSVLPVGGAGSILCRHRRRDRLQARKPTAVRSGRRPGSRRMRAGNGRAGCMSLAGGRNPAPSAPATSSTSRCRRLPPPHTDRPRATEPPGTFVLDRTPIGYGQGHDQSAAAGIRRFSIQHRHLAGVTAGRPRGG